jgi:hypothetical protein
MIELSEIRNHYAHEIVGACYFDGEEESFFTIECLDCDLVLMSDETEQEATND